MNTAVVSALETQPVFTSNPVWVPIVLVILMLLLLVWGMTRGNVHDENLPPMASASDHHPDSGDDHH